MEIQLDLFDVAELSLMKEQLKLVEKKTDTFAQRSENVRKGLFARHNELVKADQDIMAMLESIQKEILWLKQLTEEKHESEILALTEKVM